MSARAALFRAVLDTPDDDAPRLRLADWLAANGEPERAAFIRVQIAWARLPRATKPSDPWRYSGYGAPSSWTEPPPDNSLYYSVPDPHFAEKEKLRTEMNALREGHSSAWRRELPGDWPEKCDEYRRGFVESLTIPVGQLIRDPARYLDAAPIRNLTLSWEHRFGFNRYEHAPIVAAIPQLSRVQHLGFFAAGPEFVSGFMRGFVVTPEAATLRSLDLSQTNVEDDTLHALLHSDHLGALHTLDLSRNSLSTGFLEALGNTERLPGLRALLLTGCDLTPEGAERFFQGSLAGQLTSLAIAGNTTFGEGGTAVLAECSHLARFRFLALDGNAIGPGGGQHLAESPHTHNLEALSLCKAGVTGAGVAAILRSSSLARLNTLKLANNPIDAGGVLAFAASALTIPLQRFDLSRCPIGDAGARALANAPLLQSLTQLTLRDCGIGDDGASALAQSPHAAALRELDLSNNPLTDAAAETIARSPSLAQLERLRLYGSQLTDAGGLLLTELPGLRPHGLLVGGDNITKRGDAMIEKRMEARRKPKT